MRQGVLRTTLGVVGMIVGTCRAFPSCLRLSLASKPGFPLHNDQYLSPHRCRAISAPPTSPETTARSGIGMMETSLRGRRRIAPCCEAPFIFTARYGHVTSGGEAEDNQEAERRKHMEPAWTYDPYTPTTRPSSGRWPVRRFSTEGDWVVPQKLTIPEDKVGMSFVRSSGAGGQNVNKVNTQVVVKFHVMNATWIPLEVRERLIQNEANRIAKDGFMTLASQEYRTQAQNRKNVIGKLGEIILKSYPRPKTRKLRNGVSEVTKERNKQFKRDRARVKENRKNVDF